MEGGAGRLRFETPWLVGRTFSAVGDSGYWFCMNRIRKEWVIPRDHPCFKVCFSTTRPPWDAIRSRYAVGVSSNLSRLKPPGCGEWVWWWVELPCGEGG